MIRYFMGNTNTLQKSVNCSVRDELNKHGKITFGRSVSFAHHITSNHREFGDCVLTVDRNKLAKRYQIIDVDYTLHFMKRHPDICASVTGNKSYKGIIQKAKETYRDCMGEEFSGDIYQIEEMAENDLESLYGWEDEVIVKGNPVIIKADEVLNINPFP